MFGFFKRYDVELSAAVKGRITNEGKALSGVEVVRELAYGGFDKGSAVIDYALTDLNGEFSFDAKTIKSRSPGDIFGQDIPISQEIYIKKDVSEMKEGDDKYYWLWAVSKHWKPVEYLNNFMLQLNADLQNKELQHEVDLSKYGLRSNQPIVSICYWQDDLMKTYIGDELKEFDVSQK